MLAPSVIAATITTTDPSHDVMITRQSASVPVDSIDVVSFSVVETSKGTRRASLELLDLSRRGLEDRLFVQSKHAYRTYAVAESFEDFRVLNFIAVQIDDSAELRATAFLASPEGVEFLPVEATLDVATGTVSWKLRHAVDGPVKERFAFAALRGCDDDQTCQPPTPRASAFDMAPNSLAQPVAELVPAVWWESILPPDDGTVPGAPLSLAEVGNVEAPAPPSVA